MISNTYVHNTYNLNNTTHQRGLTTTDVGGQNWMEKYGRWTKLWRTSTNDYVDGTTIDDDYNGRRPQRTATMTTTMLHNDLRSRTLWQWHAEEKKDFFFPSYFFYYYFFASSMNLTTFSFDHSCKEPTKMEIEKWFLKKWKKSNVYRYGIPPVNLHKELEQQRS